ncbi:PH domain-containing protein [Nocardioides sp. zg-1228]|uniref:PH domain-containing protein n=1 Tax=Nocardioides sp. zg-1228 TaxID=2763008 RepID=UPI0016433553|nr:PH domain-containing protein [Nocardioides sp. zg-1228]MBC2932928.1 PH domain-containing protein [Nocardioides sp. zg-1228]QSF56870.1 PH domain-containing protein [Nocardioides sp. zg-1228]
MIPAPGEGWVRLSPRKLLLDPVKAVGQAIVPVAVALVGISRSDTRFWPIIIPLAVLGPLVLGALPWLTTYYRLTDTQLQVRRGILNKTTSTAPLDRVRSVDLEASLLHRILGLQKVQIGTGVDDDRMTLDALAAADAHALRTTLLRRRAADGSAQPPHAPVATPVATPAAGPAPDGAPVDQAGAPTAAPPATPPAALSFTPLAPPVALAAIDWSWLRFAPFSLGRLVLLLGGLGVLSQFADDLPIWNEDTATSVWQWLTQFAVLAIVLAVAVGGTVLWLVVSVAGYVLQWWGFRLVREQGSLHLTSGLVTTRSITVEEAKVRGVEMTEPALMRLVGGAELATLATGVENGVTQVLPPCPRDVAVAVGEAVLDRPGPLTGPLVDHGPAAHRRAWFRQLRHALEVIALLAVGWWWFDLGWSWLAGIAVVLLAIAAAAGESSYRHLGHALTTDHLVAGSGTLARVRTVLETDGIIGWVVSQSWWQRRIGLADLTATTAAGTERVVVRDVRLDVAVALADRATPGLLTPFVEPAPA